MKRYLVILLLLSVALTGCSQTKSIFSFKRKNGILPFNPQLKPFYHGVASGDPLSDRVIIWTRITPDTSTQTITTNWQMATDTAMQNIVQSGTVSTDATKDFTVKVDVTGLSPATTYYYSFTSDGITSTIGRARTAPTGTVNHLRFAVASCNNYEAGFFNAFDRIADRNDLDAVIHLGDYIYEYATKVAGDASTNRFVEPEKEAVSLGEYRTRYSSYKLDADLQRVHQQQTFITVWDDHESSNDSYKDGAQNHQANEGSWDTRREISKQVYFEWMPIRDYPANKIYRTIRYGTLADLIMLDTRLEGRDKLPTNFDDPDTPKRNMLGDKQYNWFMEELNNSQAQWKIIGNQVIFSDFNVGFSARNGMGLPAPSNMNAIREVENIFVNFWESYPTERNSIIDTIEQNGIKNVVFITGDSHASWAFDVTKQAAIYPDSNNSNYASPSPTYDRATGKGSVAVEFCTPSITSANFDERVGSLLANQFENWTNTPIMLMNNSIYNPHLKFADVDRHGYFILDLKDDSAQANYFYVDRINKPSKKEAFEINTFAMKDSCRVMLSNTPAKQKDQQEIPAPNKLSPPLGVNTPKAAVVFHAYPNPAHTVFNVQYGLLEKSEVSIEVFSIDGKKISTWQQEQKAGLYTFTQRVAEYKKGMYFYRITANGKTTNGKFLVE